MTEDEIRAAIVADPALQALVPDTTAIATQLSAGRVRYEPTEIGVGTIIEALGLATANAVLDVIYSAPDYRHVKPLLDQSRLRLDSPFVRAALQEMVPGLLTQPQCDALLSRAQVPDPVSEFAVRLAIYNDDGSMKV